MANVFQMERQMESNWCWAAVGVSVKRYFLPESDLTQCKLATQVLGHNCCEKPLDTPDYLEDALGRVGVLKKRLPNTILHFEDIQKEISAGFPVCVRIQWQGQNSGHFVVICGVAFSESREPWVDVADPLYGDIKTMPYKDFVGAYHGDGTWSDTFLVKQP